MIKVGIIGAAGYTGGELLRILTYHPDVQIVWAVSRSNFGKPVYDVHADLFGDTELKFAEQQTEKVDVVFFCTAHGETGKLMAEYNFPSDVKIIDMSTGEVVVNVPGKLSEGNEPLSPQQTALQEFMDIKKN